jgi:glycosyltransferase involved in cell wall biosynthesis
MADKLAQMHIETHVHPRFFGWRVPCYILHRYCLKNMLMRQCAEHKIDLIHCSYLWYSQYSLFLAGQLQCPCVIHVRGPVQNGMVKRNGFAQADNIIAVSARIRNNLVDAGISPDKISLIFDGIDTDLFCPCQHNKQCFSSNGEFVFGLVGRIEQAKYQMEFVLAAAILAARGEKVKFVIVGQERDSVYARKIKNYIKNTGLADRIIFSGRCENMPEVLNGFDMLVSLSGGSVMYEAMSCGIPVLSAGFTKKKDSVYVVDGFNALLLDSREPDSIALAMEKILRDKAYRQALADNTRSQVMQHLTDRVMTAQTQALYGRLLNRYQAVLPNKGQ